MNELKTFSFWCQSVLPVVYDESLSYYELLCKVVDYINNIIDDLKLEGSEIEELKQEVAAIQNKLDTFGTSYAEEIIKQYLATMIFVEINDSGYIVYNIPDSWDSIVFNTTGYDTYIAGEPYGKLVLSY